MKANRLQPSDLVLRCLAFERRGYWVAMCIDLDLAVQADTAAQARKKLREQMVSYVEDALSVDADHAAYLLNRRAPLRYFARYYFYKLLNHAKKRGTYEAAMPMVPAHS